jgi:pimeloyl-ACP methyl ester carboxylesterase
MRTLVLMVVLAGCARYAARPPLDFADLPYTSLAGQAWPEHTLALEKTAASLGLAHAPRVTYVELNPGGAQALVFIHGLGSYLKFWRYQLDELAGKGYRVIAIDLPGYGKSDKPAGFPYTMESFAAAVHEVVETLGVSQPILIGHSMGGHTALTFALQYPGEARALVLTSPAGFEKFSARERAWFQAAVRSELIVTATEEDIWSSVRAANFQRWRPELDWLVEERVRVRRSPAFAAYAYANVMSVRGLSHTDFVRANLAAIRVPTLIVFGEDDQLIPNPFMHGGRAADVMAFGHAGIEGSQLVGLPGCGHSVQLDCPGAYNAAVETFLGKL